jgi:hypothetical protein
VHLSLFAKEAQILFFVRKGANGPRKASITLALINEKRQDAISDNFAGIDVHFIVGGRRESSD